MRADARTGLGRGAIATALLLSAMWGLNIVGIKVSLAAFPPVWNAFWRMLLGWPVIWIWARATGVRLRPRSGEARPLVILGAVFAIQIIMLNVSVGWTSAAFASVLLNAAPVFINVIAHFVVPGDRLSTRRVVGLALAFGGVAFTLLGRPDASVATKPLWGNILGVVTAAVIAGRMVYTQRLVQFIDPIRTVFWQVGFSLPAFLACAIAWEPMMVGPLTLAPLLAWLYCSFGVVGLAFLLWIRLLKTNSLALLSVFVFPTPIFGILFSALVFGERPPVELIVGVLGVASGILLVSLERRKRAVEKALEGGSELCLAAWTGSTAPRDASRPGRPA